MEKTLVAYFSAGGVTERVAKLLSDASGGELFEIKPKIPYTQEDLNWRDSDSRSTLEMRDKASRPEMQMTALDISDYDRIFVGFPIWWYVAPHIINTFLESYDFSEKKVVLFATSGGSGFGETLKELTPSVSAQTELVEGKILNGDCTTKELENWIKTLDT